MNEILFNQSKSKCPWLLITALLASAPFLAYGTMAKADGDYRFVVKAKGLRFIGPLISAFKFNGLEATLALALRPQRGLPFENAPRGYVPFSTIFSDSPTSSLQRRVRAQLKSELAAYAHASEHMGEKDGVKNFYAALARLREKWDSATGKFRFPPDVEDLVFKERDANTKCKSGTDDVATSACELRDRVLGPKLSQLGYCYGRIGENESSYEWHECGYDALGYPTDVEKIEFSCMNDKVQELSMTVVAGSHERLPNNLSGKASIYSSKLGRKEGLTENYLFIVTSIDTTDYTRWITTYSLNGELSNILAKIYDGQLVTLPVGKGGITISMPLTVSATVKDNIGEMYQACRAME